MNVHNVTRTNVGVAKWALGVVVTVQIFGTLRANVFMTVANWPVYMTFAITVGFALDTVRFIVKSWMSASVTNTSGVESETPTLRFATPIRWVILAVRTTVLRLEGITEHAKF